MFRSDCTGAGRHAHLSPLLAQPSTAKVDRAASQEVKDLDVQLDKMHDA